MNPQHAAHCPPDMANYVVGPRWGAAHVLALNPGCAAFAATLGSVVKPFHGDKHMDTDDANAILEVLKALRRTGDRLLEADIIKRLNVEAPAYAINPMVVDATPVLELAREIVNDDKSSKVSFDEASRCVIVTSTPENLQRIRTRVYSMYRAIGVALRSSGTYNSILSSQTNASKKMR